MTGNTPSDSTHEAEHEAASTSVSRRTVLSALGAGAVTGLSPAVGAHPDGTSGTDGVSSDDLSVQHAPDPSLPLIELDAGTSNLGASQGDDLSANIELTGRGERLLEGGTTDVWAHNGYAYLGTFNTPCGTGDGYGGGSLVDDKLGPGVPVFNVEDPSNPTYVGNIPSVKGSRANDVKVDTMNSGDILVHSNEPCDGGPGGFEIYNVDDPTSPSHQASVRVKDANQVMRDQFGITDEGVHNLFLFTQGDTDYVALVGETTFGGFQIYDITDPANPQVVSRWGAELTQCGDCRETLYAEKYEGGFNLLSQLNQYMTSGVGDSQNRFLHDVTINKDGTRAYLAHWDAGLILLDIADPANPQLVSVARDPTAADGEVNSHQAWPAEDGSVVVETEEDFDGFTLEFSSNGQSFEAVQGSFTKPITSLSGRAMAGPTRYVGLACDAGSVPDAESEDEIAVVRRGECRFDAKAKNVMDAGYAGFVVFNDAASGDALLSMGGQPRDIPGVMVGHSTGLSILGAASVDGLSVGDTGDSIRAEAEPQRWGNVRIWDYSDPANPVLASQFDTRCSIDPAHSSCDPRGTYSVHNSIVEGDKAFLSWYSDGVLIVDISDPYSPVETARYNPTTEEFEEQNGGIQDVWGIYKVPGEPPIYASDRNGGLYILKETDSADDGGDNGDDGEDGTEEPTETPEPTETEEPTETPEPTETEEPTETPEPTETEEPTDTPEPTETETEGN